MTDKLYDIAFSGKIAEGADLDLVKQKIGKIFKADETRLSKLFSGQRVLIKRSVDEITMIKYRGAFQKSGAICEVVELTPAETSASAEVQQTKIRESVVQQTESAEYVSKYPESDEIPQALMSAPLGVHAENIEDLVTDVAPVGSQLLSNIEQVPEPVIDISGMDVAPVGSTLSVEKRDALPPPPDTTGLSMAD